MIVLWNYCGKIMALVVLLYDYGHIVSFWQSYGIILVIFQPNHQTFVAAFWLCYGGEWQD